MTVDTRKRVRRGRVRRGAGLDLGRRGRPQLTQEDRIRTVALYIQTGNTNRVAEILGITGKSVRHRLLAIGCPTKPQGGGYQRNPVWEQQVNDVLTLLKKGLA